MEGCGTVPSSEALDFTQGSWWKGEKKPCFCKEDTVGPVTVARLLKGWIGRLRWDCQRDPGKPPEMEASAKMSMFLQSQGLWIKKYCGCPLLPLGRRLLASTINFSFLQATEQQRADRHSFPGTCCFQRPLPPPVSDCCLFRLLTLGCL